MNRNRFLKFATLGFLAPFFAKGNEPVKPERTSNVSSNSNYVHVTHDIHGNEMTDSLCDGVLNVKENNSYYFYQPTTVDVKDFGAVGDGEKDDTQAVQNAVSSCIKNKKTLYLSRPMQSYICKKKIVINGQIYIYGDGMSLCGVNFVNCDGFEITEGTSNVIIEKITINQLVRQTTTNNNFTAIRILGSDKKRSVTHVYRDLFIDGFNAGFKINWLWDAQFDNVKILFGKIGFDIAGLSVNNNISDSSIQVEGNDSKAIFFSDPVNPAEGWKITNLLTFGADYGIHSIYASNVYVTSPILDFCKKYGIYLESGVGPSTNWQVIGGYIAMSGKNAVAGIGFNNTKDNNQIRGNKILYVDILGYPDSGGGTGVIFQGQYDVNNIINSSFTNFKEKARFKNNKSTQNNIN